MRYLRRVMRQQNLGRVLDSEQGIACQIAAVMAGYEDRANVNRLSTYAARVVASAHKVEIGQLSEEDFLNQMGLAGNLDVAFTAEGVVQAYLNLVHEHPYAKSEGVRVLRTAGRALDNKEHGVTVRS